MAPNFAPSPTPSRPATEVTCLFELLVLEFKVRLDYGSEAKIVLLAAVETATGVERDVKGEAKKFGAESAVEVEDAKVVAIEELAKKDVMGEEGRVVKWPDCTRVKIKFKSYLRKIMANGRGDETEQQLRARVMGGLCYRKSLVEVLDEVDDERHDEVQRIMEG